MIDMRRTFLALAALAFAGCGEETERPSTYTRAQEWDDATLELAARLPVQDGGRVKPLDTLAGFKLLKFNGKRSLELPGGEKLDRTGWALDCLFFPEQAVQYEAFLVQNGQVLTGIGLEPKKKRARYSYEELLAGRRRLFEEANKIQKIEPKKRDPIQSQTFKLASDVHEFEMLIHELDFARTTFDTDGSEGLVAIYGPELQPGLAHVLRGVPKLIGALRQDLSELPEEEQQLELQAVSALSNDLSTLVEGRGGTIGLYAPSASAPDAPTWWTTGDVVKVVFDGAEPVDRQLEVVAGLERMHATRNERAEFRSALESTLASSSALAEARGEYAKVPMEVGFYQRDYFTNALVFFLLGFLCLAGTWLAPTVRWLRWGLLGSVSVGTVYVAIGITLRCIIRSRPPVSTLYETILFITACLLLVALAIEWINRARIAIALTPILGALGMFLSMKYELKEAASAGDTMPSLVAVLDTNFWLSTHVTTVTLGYAAGLLAAAIAHVWLLGKVFGLKRGDKAFYKSVSRMTYGVICFGLLFSVVGTILGGVWANYSWGRFWGWDPKENGALLICIWELLILHARLGGYIRDMGLAVMAVLGGLVVAFSWWGVNLLSIGLHSYGFTEGIFTSLVSFYGIELLVLAVAGGWWIYERGRSSGGGAIPG